MRGAARPKPIGADMVTAGPSVDTDCSRPHRPEPTGPGSVAAATVGGPRLGSHIVERRHRWLPRTSSMRPPAGCRRSATLHGDHARLAIAWALGRVLPGVTVPLRPDPGWIEHGRLGRHCQPRHEWITASAQHRHPERVGEQHERLTGFRVVALAMAATVREVDWSPGRATLPGWPYLAPIEAGRCVIATVRPSCAPDRAVERCGEVTRDRPRGGRRGSRGHPFGSRIVMPAASWASCRCAARCGRRHQRTVMSIASGPCSLEPGMLRAW